MDYKEKYNEALEKAKKNYDVAQDLYNSSQIGVECFKNTLTNIFPELKETEDERMFREIKRYIKEQGDKPTGLPNGTVAVSDMITWLEKQDKQQGKSVLEVWKNMRLEVYQQASGNRHEPNYSDDSTRMFSLSDIDEIIEKISEQSHNDKTEPKFKVGDCVVNNNSGGVCQVTKIRDDKYCLWPLYSEILGYLRIIDVDTDYHLWTIADAIDGDVIVCNINKAEIGGDVEKLPNMTPTICIYQNVVKDSEYIHSYCSLYDENSLVLQNTMYYNAFVYNIQPATQEQRDLLFQKMAEAGYEWDGEKKELKKIEPKFSVDDWIVTEDSFGKIVRHIDAISYNLIVQGYTVSDENGLIYKISFSNENKWHKWTIQDAEDGDVLVASDNSIFLFAGVDDCACKYYVVLTTDNYLKINKEAKGGYWETSRAVYPATKEQRNLLFQKMKEAGYELDANKKELKKIEPKKLDPDKVIEWLNNQACLGWIEDVEVDKFVDKFKKDFEL